MARDDDELRGLPLPREIKERRDRARSGMKKDADKRKVMVKFWQNEPYWYVKAKGGVGVLPTAVDAVDKSNYRIRNTYNYIHAIVEGKVSAASQRVPGYEVDPSSTDPEDIAGARIAQQVAFYGHDQWRLRRHKTKAITNALVQREGFIYPYFDPNVGPYTETLDPDTGEIKVEGQGELKHLSLSRSEVGWEPGVDFEDSPYYIVERAFLAEEIEKIPGFVGGKLLKDAKLSELPSDKATDQMTLLTEFLERPCPKYPNGRRCFIANDQIVVDYRKVDPESEDWWEEYPYQDADGNVVDEPCIHRLSYTVDPEGDDRGLVELLIDLQRTILDCWNKLLEYKNRALNLQMTAPLGSNMSRRSDQPGITYTYNPAGGLKPEWEPLPDPGYVNQLLQVLEQAKTDMRAIAADIDVQPDPDLAAKTANAAIEQSQARWQSFLGDVAEFDSRLMRHNLTLVARHYDTERLMPIRGTHGWEPLKAFTGATLNNQVNVRVLPGSIEAKTHSAQMQELQFIVGTWGPEAISPEMAMSALHGGNVETLFRSFDLHKARAWALVQKVREDYKSVLSMEPRFDPEYGDPTQGFMVPGWMPREQDNLVIWKQVISDYMCEPDFDEQPPEVQQMFDLIWGGLKQLEQRKVMQLQAQTMDVAAQQGAANAAAPQGNIPSPQVNGLSQQQAQPDALTPS